MNTTKAPRIIRYAIAVNNFSVVCFGLCSLTAAYLGFVHCFPLLSSKAEKMGIALDSNQYTILFLASIVMWLLPIPILLIANKGILVRRKGAGIVQLIISTVMLLVIPVGTILNGIVIFYFLADAKTKDYLKGRPENV